jgi:hypothetical protein
MTLTDDRPPVIPKPHAGNRYTKGPPAYVETGLGGMGGSTGEVMAGRGMEIVTPLEPSLERNATASTNGAPYFARKLQDTDYKRGGPYTFDLGDGDCGVVPSNTLLDRSNTPSDDVLPNDAKARKAVPAGAVLDYFDSAIVEIAKALQDGNDQHNPGEPLHWARGKSSDHAHCIIRHYLQRGKLAVSPTGAVIRHSTYMAIRALMFLQEELEANGAPLSRGSRLPETK